MSEPKISYMQTMAGATAVYINRSRVGTIMQAENGWVYVPGGLTLSERVDLAADEEEVFFATLDEVKASLEES